MFRKRQIKCFLIGGIVLIVCLIAEYWILRESHFAEQTKQEKKVISADKKTATKRKPSADKKPAVDKKPADLKDSSAAKKTLTKASDFSEGRKLIRLICKTVGINYVKEDWKLDKTEGLLRNASGDTTEILSHSWKDENNAEMKIYVVGDGNHQVVKVDARIKCMPDDMREWNRKISGSPLQESDMPQLEQVFYDTYSDRIYQIGNAWLDYLGSALEPSDVPVVSADYGVPMKLCDDLIVTVYRRHELCFSIYSSKTCDLAERGSKQSEGQSVGRELPVAGTSSHLSIEEFMPHIGERMHRTFSIEGWERSDSGDDGAASNLTEFWSTEWEEKPGSLISINIAAASERVKKAELYVHPAAAIQPGQDAYYEYCDARFEEFLRALLEGSEKDAAQPLPNMRNAWGGVPVWICDDIYVTVDETLEERGRHYTIYFADDYYQAS